MLIAIVFIAELIIAFQIISLIIKADRKVCDINACVKEFNPLAQTFMQYIRCFTQTFSANTKKCVDFIKKQRKKVIVNTVITVAMYGILILFRLKRIKLRKIGSLVIAIHDIASDLAV